MDNPPNLNDIPSSEDVKRGRRDAVHIAVIACEYRVTDFRVPRSLKTHEHWLFGEPVRVFLADDGLSYYCEHTYTDRAHGVICGFHELTDAYMYDSSKALEVPRVWVMLKPNTITGLEHRWVHPTIPERQVAVQDAREANDKYALETAEAWALIAQGAGYAQCSQQEFVEAMDTYALEGFAYNIGANQSYEQIPDDLWPKLWAAYKVVSTRFNARIEKLSHGSPFTCSC